MAKRRLPTGIQTFRELRESDCYYVDKTGYALRLFQSGKHYFLSRPRRFGKSLFLDTLKELFDGSQSLFVGLDVHDHWDWSVAFPVVRLDFGGLNATKPSALDEHVQEQLAEIENDANMPTHQASAPLRFRHLLRTLHRDSGQRVCVLVDEYDKPILDALEKPDLARANREYLHGLYGMIKSCDAHIRFSFLTGVSKFSKVSLFSGLNNLIDITLDERYAAICGYTESDIDTVFAAELPGLDREQIREWYNGYSWGLPADTVYNPFALLLLFDKRTFAPWWFETGTPSFLTKLLTERCVAAYRLDGLRASMALLNSFDVGSIATEALLFQTGYLTVGRRERGDDGIEYFRLAYPNREVRQSLNLSLLNYVTGDPSQREEQSQDLQGLLRSGDMDGLEAWFRALFAGIPYHWHSRNTIADYEGYYASVFYSFFVGSGATVTAEDSGSTGRADLAVQTASRTYLFEFKVFTASQQGAALRQLQERDYAAKYHHRGLPIHLVGVEFNAQTRTVEVFETAFA
ncbi:MAG: ATP-binding protein [Bryobacterales bacterium]|nr:ATP-binding protein [Bryobacterales bacterium]MDE0261416.1 ATP-binding protein [Bryobacterales bacterium]MDE0623585.1 ATP-binding protein [Bryobacterales bacterium]